MLEWVGRCSPYPKLHVYRSTVWSAVLLSQVQQAAKVALLQRVANY